MPETLILFPWQLAERLLPRFARVVLLRDHFRRTGRDVLPFHKLKLAWNMAICVEFAREKRIEIVDWNAVVRIRDGRVCVYDPLDHDLYDDLSRTFGDRLTVLELEKSFMLGTADLSDLRDRFSGLRKISHAAFFQVVREKTGTLVGVASTDSENRRPLPSGSRSPPDAAFINRGRSLRTCAECAAFVERHHASNVGSTEMLVRLPITRRDAVRYFDDFLDRKFDNYGAYQDAIDKDAVELYHSHCSHLINVGILTPKDVVRRVIARIGGQDAGNNVEGFVRQVLGWREYMRFIYRFWGRDLKADMLAAGGSALDFGAWNGARTGVAPVDGEIRKVLKTAWSHHIVRLMIFLNFMKLSDVRPRDIYRWFMTVVSLDAYEWVMVSNIMAMGYFDRRFTSRHYVSSSKYVLRMSNYERDGRWDVLWDSLYRKYVDEHGVFGSRKK